MRLRSPQLAVLAIGIMLGGITLTIFAGLWQSESSKVPATYTSGEFSGTYNPADIRGSYSFGDIASAFDVPVDLLLQAFGFEQYDEAVDLQIKLFEEVYGAIEGKEIGVDSMRLFVALYLSRPYTPEEDTGLPRRAVDLLAKQKDIDEEEAHEYAERYAVTLPKSNAADPSAAIDSSGEEPESEEDTTIKGKTTFLQLIEWGLSREKIKEVIGMPPGPPTQALRDFFMEKGASFSEVKDELQGMVDERSQ